MNELQDNTLKRPMDKSNIGADVGALNNLLGMLNNPAITGAVLPDGTAAADPAIPQQAKVTPPVAAKPATPRVISGTKFAFTGKLKSGKDYVAAALGAKIFGFAEPLYALQDHFFGTNASTNAAHKDIPGARAFLQTVGQWGWGAIDEKYPLTPARACFTTMIRSLGAAGVFPAHLAVDWDTFGRSKRVWVDAAFRRIEAYLEQHPGSKVAIVNARFEHEFLPLREAGFEHYHVMCSQKTWAARLAQSGLNEASPNVKDLSERLAHGLDADVIKKISAQKSGPMLKAIWNDDKAPSPSPRLYSLPQFLASANTAAPDYASAE